MRPLISIAIVACLASIANGQAVTLSTGEHARESSIVRFRVDAAPGEYILAVENGPKIPVTVDTALGTAIVTMPANTKWTGRLEKAPAAGNAIVDAARKAGVVDFSFAGKQILRYQGEMSPLPNGYNPRFQRGGYIHPVYSPAGLMVTDDYPVNHKHHHGIWSPWTKTEFEGRHPDFWNMGDGTGTVEFVELVSTHAGACSAGLVSKHRMVDLSAKPEPKIALNETWTVRAYPTRPGATPVNIFDVSMLQTCASASPLTLPKYHYGGMGFRGPGTWDGKGKLTVLTSEGKDVSNGNETRARWFVASGLVQGKVASIAVLCHPSNFRFPQPLRVHPTEPFICWAPSQLGEFQITPEKPYAAQYRYLVCDGEMPKELIEQLWRDYAE